MTETDEFLTLSALRQTHLYTTLNNTTETVDLPELEDEVVTQLINRVILFNDEWHTFDEVIDQVIKAIGCTVAKAEEITLEVHEKGKAKVYEGELGECLRVSSVLEEIHLRTQIEC